MSSFIHLQGALLQIPNCFNISQDLKKASIKRYSKRIPSRVKQIILHHSAHPTWDVYDICNYHVTEKKWPGIGYHIVISQDGTIFITNNLDTQSYHCANHNFKSIGICCLGNFENHIMKEIQERALMMVLWTIGTHFDGLEINGHKDLAATLCPGLHFPLIESKNHYHEAIKYRSIEM